jgi:hypothetical protein
MNDKDLRNHMAEKGYEMTPSQLRLEKESLVRKLAPELLEDGISVDEALNIILTQIKIK